MLPRFSDQEYRRRRALVDRLCAGEQLDALLVYGSSANARQGQAQVHYLTNFLGRQESLLLVVPGQEPILFVQYFNHVPHAQRVARADVRWGGARSIDAVAAELSSRGRAHRIGIVGPLPFQDRERLEVRLGGAGVADVTSKFLRLRLLKSDEEIAWMERAACVTDAALSALVHSATPGRPERELEAAAMAAAIEAGGQPHFLYLSSTPMARPDRAVPAQDLSDRRLEPGDAVIFELSAASWGYSGQVLRTLVVEAEPTELYRVMHEVAWEAFRRVAGVIKPGAPAQAVVDAAAVIEEHGFTVCDDLVHGFGGGYLAPVLRPRSAAHGPAPDFRFEENMTVVVQPNVVTPDQRAGVQVGELLRVVDGGVASLHRVPQRLLRGGEKL